MTAARIGKGAAKRVKLTPPFPADVNPVRIGEYECSRLEYRPSPERSKYVKRRLLWDGSFWLYSANTPSGARSGDIACMFSSDGDTWRGLASDPSKDAT